MDQFQPPPAPLDPFQAPPATTNELLNQMNNAVHQANINNPLPQPAMIATNLPLRAALINRMLNQHRAKKSSSDLRYPHLGTFMGMSSHPASSMTHTGSHTVCSMSADAGSIKSQVTGVYTQIC